MIEKCIDCQAADIPPPNRKMYIGCMNNRFNDVVCVDHFYLERILIFHYMVNFSRYSTRFLASGASLEAAKFGMEATWMSEFWPTRAVQGDISFQHP